MTAFQSVGKRVCVTKRGKSVTSTKCGKMLKVPRAGKKLLLVASAISSTNGTKSGKMCKEYIVCIKNYDGSSEWGGGGRGGYLYSNKLALFSCCFHFLRFYEFLFVLSGVNKRYLDNRWGVN